MVRAVRHRSFGPAHRTLAPKVRSARPGFAAPARPGLRLGRVESLVRATVVSVPPDREPGASRREPGSARRAFSRKPRSTTAVCDRNFGRSPRFPTANCGRQTETSIDPNDWLRCRRVAGLTLAARICDERGAGLSPDRGSRSSAPNCHHKVAVGRGANRGGAIGSPTESAGRKRGRRDRTFGPKTRHGPL